MSKPQLPETDAPSPMYFEERLWPSGSVWFVGVAFGLVLGIVVYPFGWTAVAVVSAVATSVIVGLLAATSPRLAIDAGSLRAGRAHIPLAEIGEVEILDRERMRHLRGPGIDARAYLCIRSWIPGGLRVAVDDESDPTPWWLISSRQSELAAKAIRLAKSRSQGGTDRP